MSCGRVFTRFPAMQALIIGGVWEGRAGPSLVTPETEGKQEWLADA